jgi:hypothetical protein
VKVCEDIERLIEAIVSGIPGSQVSTGSPGQRPARRNKQIGAGKLLTAAS